MSTAYSQPRRPNENRAKEEELSTDVYVNHLAYDDEERVKAAYGVNYERLVALKDKYDPTNFFRMNQNIKPNA